MPTGLTRCLTVALLALLLQPASHALADHSLRYPRPMPGHEQRNSYIMALLQLTLDKAGSHLRLQPSEHYMEQRRSLRELQLGRSVEVVWAMTRRERETELLPIRIPLDKGLLGWRLALVKKQARTPLGAIHDRQALQRLRAGQGHDWPDSQILAHNGLPVITSASYPSLFRMLEAGRFEYFPRSLLEIWDEAAQPQNARLEVDRHLLLVYPTASYFFVSPGNTRLAGELQRGLEQALADCSFDRLFFAHYGDALQRARLSERQLIELDNPLLPPDTPLQRAELSTYIAWASEFVKLSPRSTVYFTGAAALDKLGHHAEAEQWRATGARLFPADPLFKRVPSEADPTTSAATSAAHQ